MLSLQDGGGIAGTVNARVGGGSALRKCALVSEGRRGTRRGGRRGTNVESVEGGRW